MEFEIKNRKRLELPKVKAGLALLDLARVKSGNHSLSLREFDYHVGWEFPYMTVSDGVVPGDIVILSLTEEEARYCGRFNETTQIWVDFSSVNWEEITEISFSRDGKRVFRGISPDGRRVILDLAKAQV